MGWGINVHGDTGGSDGLQKVYDKQDRHQDNKLKFSFLLTLLQRYVWLKKRLKDSENTRKQERKK